MEADRHHRHENATKFWLAVRLELDPWICIPAEARLVFVGNQGGFLHGSTKSKGLLRAINNQPVLHELRVAMSVPASPMRWMSCLLVFPK